MKTITVIMKNGVNHSYNDKDYPFLCTSADSAHPNLIWIKFRNNDNEFKTLLLIPISEIRYIKYKYSQTKEK